VDKSSTVTTTPLVCNDDLASAAKRLLAEEWMSAKTLLADVFMNDLRENGCCIEADNLKK
jgi:hypothetical protein